IVTPNDLVLAPIGSTVATAEAHDQAGAVVDATFVWQSSDTTIATVVDGLVTGIAPGEAHVTASAGGVSSSPAAVHVVVGSGTSDLLIKAVAAGEIDSDQALVYEVFDLFGDDRLPEKYRGSATGSSLRRDLLMVEAAGRFDAMTVEQQAAIGKYFVPP